MMELIETIVASVLCVIIVIALIVWLFIFSFKTVKLQNEKTKVQIDYYKQRTKYYMKETDGKIDEEK